MYILIAFIFLVLHSPNEFANINKPDSDNLYNVVTINNDTINLLSLSKKQINIFVQQYGCHNCYIQIDNVLKRINKNYGKRFIVNLIIRCGNGIISRNYVKDYIVDFIKSDNIFFDIHNEMNIDYQQETKEGLFGKYNVKYTPELLFINGNNLKHYSYKDIFGNKHRNIEKIIAEIIIKELLSD